MTERSVEKGVVVVQERNEKSPIYGKSVYLVGNRLLADESLQSFTAQYGASIKEFSDLNELIRHLGRSEEGPDLVIVDSSVENSGEIALPGFIAVESPEVPVIVVTDHDSSELQIMASALGAFDYLPRPFSPERLQVSVLNALERLELAIEVEKYRQELKKLQPPDGIIGRSPAMKRVYTLIGRFAASAAKTILLTGETGTGKELVADKIHHYSPRERRHGPYRVVNCAAIPEKLLESMLFGHVKGAFTGATSDKPGEFLLANGGTLILDEIDELPLELQSKVLRAIEEGTFIPVGAKEIIAVDVRVVATSNRNLLELVRKGSFADDLYYRINKPSIFLPPLRERKEDIPYLVAHFLNSFGDKGTQVSRAALELLMQHNWPGNVRELRDVIEEAVIISQGRIIKPEHVALPSLGEDSVLTVDVGYLQDQEISLKTIIGSVERELVQRALMVTNHDLIEAAKKLRITRKQMQALVDKYGIESNH